MESIEISSYMRQEPSGKHFRVPPLICKVSEKNEGTEKQEESSEQSSSESECEDDLVQTVA